MHKLLLIILILFMPVNAGAADIFIEPFEEPFEGPFKELFKEPRENPEYMYEDVPDSENPLFNFLYDDNLTGEAWREQGRILIKRGRFMTKYFNNPKIRMKLWGCYPGSRKEKDGFCEPIQQKKDRSSVQEASDKIDGAVEK